MFILSFLCFVGYTAIKEKTTFDLNIVKEKLNRPKKLALFQRILISMTLISVVMAFSSYFVMQKSIDDEYSVSNIVWEELGNFNFNLIDSNSDKDIFKDGMDKFINEKLRDKKFNKYFKYLKLYTGKQNSSSAIKLDGTTPLNMDSFYSYVSEPKGEFAGSNGRLAETKTKDGYSIYYEVATSSKDLSVYSYSYLVSGIIGVISFVILFVSLVLPRVKRLR